MVFSIEIKSINLEAFNKKVGEFVADCQVFCGGCLLLLHDDFAWASLLQEELMLQFFVFFLINTIYIFLVLSSNLACIWQLIVSTNLSRNLYLWHSSKEQVSSFWTSRIFCEESEVSGKYFMKMPSTFCWKRRIIEKRVGVNRPNLTFSCLG